VNQGEPEVARVAVRIVGGVLTSFIMELAVYAAIYFVWRGWHLSESEPTAAQWGERLAVRRRRPMLEVERRSAKTGGERWSTRFRWCFRIFHAVGVVVLLGRWQHPLSRAEGSTRRKRRREGGPPLPPVGELRRLLPRLRRLATDLAQ
jgi:hypothetical protein